MRYKRSVLLAVGSCALLSAVSCGSEPTIRIQQVAWTPPTTTLPAEYITAAKQLLGNGLSDPRQAKEFHKVTVNVGDAAWTAYGPVTASGWMMSDGKHVIAVDGLTYDVVKDLGTATIDDILHPVAEETKLSMLGRGVHAINTNNSALPALLLLRGDVKNAELAYGGTKVQPAVDLYAHFMYRYTMQVAQCLMDRRDQEAVAWAEKLASVDKVRIANNVNYGKDTVGWRFDDGEGLAIFKDVQRRAKQARKPIDLASLKSLSQKDRIAALVDGLDEVSARQMGQPGGTDWFMDPILQELSQEGQASVPALLDALERDERYTRSVSFGRDFFPRRHIQTVKSAAYAALQWVWPASRTADQDMGPDRVKKLRLMWEEAKLLSPAEQWLAVLKNDAAGDRAWADAARALMAPANKVSIGWTSSSNGTAPALMESLRAKHTQEVADVLTKRSLSVTSPIQQASNSGELFVCSNGLTVAHALAKFDLKAAMKTLVQVSHNAITYADAWQKSGEYVKDNLGRSYASVIADRIQGGDPDAAKEFGSWLPRIQFEGFVDPLDFKPLWAAPENQELQRVASTYFSGLAKEFKESDNQKFSQKSYALRSMIGSPLMQSKVFRSFLVGLIRMDGEIGTCQYMPVAGGGNITYSLGNNGSGSMGLPRGMSTEGLSTEKVPMSRGDYVAQQLVDLHGCPSFAIPLPEAKRKAAKEAVIKWLEDKAVDWTKVHGSIPYYEPD